MKASHSEISCYLECRVKHHFRYRQRLPIVGQSLRLEQGSAVHAGLELAAKGETDINQAQAASVKRLHQTLVEISGDDVQAVRAATRAGLEFLKQADIAKVLAVEESFKAEIDGWTAPGVIDFVFEDSQGLHHLLDWKSSDNLPQDTTGTLDPQTALYALVWMERHGLTWMYAGRCYLRLKAPQIDITKGGRVSVQSSCSLTDYEQYVKENPEHAGTEKEQAQAREKFGPWWRHHEDMVTLDYCRALMRQWRATAAEIERNDLPLIGGANIRPKFCHKFCEYYTPCTDWVLNGEQNG
jgi:hypothetical protein